ncbi:polysaccharide deacetylase family protein [Halobacterium wangiae]|uniref:polysaccharide deacetylase family protein n=1 Tax=Halobacterium wangiae TaxID=2902623 RepID=UPI001E2F7DC7|nr:polysaccharide deacetylase family protein [Halobacterium wangiae]
MAVTISIEIELGWGVHDVGEYPHLSDDGSAERACLGRLLEHCDSVDVPISFDVVGHLFESDCAGDHDGPHREGWFDNDPGTDEARDPLFYAPEMVRQIRDHTTDHELCTHTYSHVICGEATPETVAWELEEAQSLIRAATGSGTDSIVPPRHSRPPAEQLREAGIECMRMSRDTSDRSTAARLKELLYGPHPVYEPELVDGVVETYCTSYPSLTSSALPSGRRSVPAPFRALPVRLRQRLQRQYLRRALDEAAEREGDCHLWCHLYDLSNEYQWPVVRTFLDELAARRDRGELEVRTMAELNEQVRGDQQAVRTRG